MIGKAAMNLWSWGEDIELLSVPKEIHVIDTRKADNSHLGQWEHEQSFLCHASGSSPPRELEVS